MVRVVIDGRPVRYRLAGAGQYVFNLAVALSEQSEAADFGVLLSGGRKNAEAHRLAQSISGPANRVVNGPDRRLLTGVLRFTARAVPKRALGGSFDLWHSTYFEGYPRLRAGRSLVSTIHDVIVLRHPELFARRNLAASHPALGRQVRDSTKIIAVSTFTRNQILELTSATAEQVNVAPLAVSVEPISDDDAKRRRGLLGQVGLVRLMLVRRRHRQQQVAGQTLVAAIDLHHALGDPKINVRAKVGKRHRVEVLRPDHVAVAADFAPIGPCTDLERHRRQRLQQRLLLGGEHAQPGALPLLERLPVVGIDLLSNPGPQLHQTREHLFPQPRNHPGGHVRDRVLEARFVLRVPHPAGSTAAE